GNVPPRHPSFHGCGIVENAGRSARTMLDRPRHRTGGARRRRRLRPVRRGKRAPGRVAWTVVLFGALSAIAIAVYGIANGGFRPDAQWLQLVDELRARGEPVVFEEIVPPELPE